MPLHAHVRRPPVRLDADGARILLNGDALLLDVRRNDDPADELNGSVRIPPDELPSRIDTLPRGAPILLACT